MTLEEQIGQLLVVGFWGTTPTPEILDLIQNHHIGGIIFFSRNVQDAQQVLELTSYLQMAAKAAGHRYPLLIATDQENGMVQRLGSAVTSFPGNMALGAIGSEHLVYDVALATGRELKALGINMNLAPVVDVNNNPANPVIGVRSFGEDPYQVAQLTAAAVKGYRKAGVMTSLKHFPGHGDTAVDSHLALPSIPHTLERLEATELVPFKSGIAAGADSVMIAHLHIPALMSHPVQAATLSPTIVQELLREKLGFTGVIISDCLEMRAISETVGVEQGAVLALQVGIDLILVSHLYPRQRASIEALLAAVQAGEISRQTVEQAAERVLKLKEQFLNWDELLPFKKTVGERDEAHQQLRDRAYELSTTLVKNEDGLLPLRLASTAGFVGADVSRPNQENGLRLALTDRLLVLFPQRENWTMAEDRHYPSEFFVESIRQRHANTTALSISPSSTQADYEEIFCVVRKSKAIIMLTVNAYLDQQQADLMQSLIRSGLPIIGIAVYNPYDLLAFAGLKTYMVTYEYTEPALAAAVRVLFGEISPRGCLPVSLPGLYSVGSASVPILG
ncbi:MAG: beta-N-acetylhexosaminidase [Chloroflexota bacterium]|nr:beta-N-acetylhexosaminidase [Chloroflexota bacterium]